MAEIKMGFAHWPVVLTTPPSGAVTDAELAAYLQRFRAEVARRHSPFVSVIDLRQNSGITPAQRKMIADGMAADTASTTFSKATVLVFTSSLLGHLLTAIFWIRKPEYEIKVFTELDRAIDWGRDRILSVERSMLG